MKIKESDIIHFGIDELELVCEFKHYSDLFDLFPSFEFPGESEKVFTEYVLDGFDTQVSFPGKYDFKISFYKDKIHCFAWYRGRTLNSYVTTNDYLVVYGKAFRFLGVDFIQDFIEKHFVFRKFKMIHIALDIPFSLSSFIQEFGPRCQSGGDIFGDAGKLETYYIGQKKKEKNKSSLFRFYDKLQEIKDNSTQPLYSDYLLLDNVTRLELEIRSELSEGVSFDSVFNYYWLFNTFATKLKKHSNLLRDLQTENIVLARIQKKLDIDALTPENVFNSRYLKIFKGYAGKIKDIGVCPVDVLVRAGYYLPSTLFDVSSCCDSGTFDSQEYRTGLTSRNVRNIFNT